MNNFSCDMAEVAGIIAGPSPARAMFAYVHAGLLRDAGCDLVTASIYDLQLMRSRRVFSNDPAAYPVGNFKVLETNSYYDTVILARKHFSSTTIEGIAEVFFDWKKIQALGFESNLNLPAVVGGKVLGTINLLEKKGHYTAERVDAALAWQPIVSLCFLLLEHEGGETATFMETEILTEPGVEAPAS